MGSPLFQGADSVSQLIEIIKVIGTPNRQQIEAMNKDYQDYSFPFVKCKPINKVLKGASANAIDFICNLLNYDPSKRPKPLVALLHPFFDELRAENCRLPSGFPIPDIFYFTDEEKNGVTLDIIEKLTPEWYHIN